MSIDEALFDSYNEHDTMPVLRFYGWNAPALTIGYFQHHAQCVNPGVPLTRRLTGGLAVLHGGDISYALIISAAAWPFIYDQEETYRYFHTLLAGALATCGIGATLPDVVHAQAGNSARSISCVQTLYPHDVMYDGRKIVGSCQRRRGRKLLMQGSLHISLPGGQTGLCDAFRAQAFLSGIELVMDTITADESRCADNLKRSRYSDQSWNGKR